MFCLVKRQKDTSRHNIKLLCSSNNLLCLSNAIVNHAFWQKIFSTYDQVDRKKNICSTSPSHLAIFHVNTLLPLLNGVMCLGLSIKRISAHTPMGVLAPRSAHVRPYAWPPIDMRRNVQAHVSAESPSNISTNTSDGPAKNSSPTGSLHCGTESYYKTQDDRNILNYFRTEKFQVKS